MSEGPVSEQTSGEQALPDHRIKSLRLALSGGGVRATLFAFGSILYLLDSHDARRIAAISSVSGGSIANGILANSDGIGNDYDATAVRAKIARASWHISQRGAFFAPAARSLLISVIVAPVLVALAVVFFPIPVLAMSQQSELIPVFYRYAGWGVALTAALIAGYVVFAIFVAVWGPRRSSQVAVYERALSYAENGVLDRQVARAAGKTRLRGRTDLASVRQSSVSHVFCATDLISGQPVFMSRDRVQSGVFGFGPPDMTLAKAIYASAAFPAVFPPMPLNTRKWRGMGMQASRPSRLYLTDGGIFNNLGTDWFIAADQEARASRPGEQHEESDYLIVNASKPARLKVRRAWLFHLHLTSLFRAVTVLQENTVAPRMQALRSQDMTAIVDIAESPTVLLERLESHPLADVRDRAAEVHAWLHEATRRSHWELLAAESAMVPTQLEAVGDDRALHLLRHGYMNAAVAAFCLFGSAFTPQSNERDEEWFAALLDSGRASKRRSARRFGRSHGRPGSGDSTVAPSLGSI